MASEWRIRIEDNEYPAEGVQQLRAWVHERRLMPSHYVYNPILACWIYAKDLEELKDSFAQQVGPPTSSAGLAECGYCKRMSNAELSVCPFCNVQVFKSLRNPQPQSIPLRVKPAKKSQAKLWLLLGTLLIVGTIITNINNPRSLPEETSASPRSESRTTAPQGINPMFDIHAVAGKSPAEVQKVLGKPSRQESTLAMGKRVPKYFYRDGQVEVVFIGGKADWVTVMFEGFGPMPEHNREVLGLVRLPTTYPPSLENRFMIRWEFVAGFRMINTGVDSSGRTSFLLFCLNTVPG